MADYSASTVIRSDNGEETVSDSEVKLEYVDISFGQVSDEYEALRKEIPIKEYIYLFGMDILTK